MANVMCDENFIIFWKSTIVLFYFGWLSKNIFISPWLKAVWKGEIECRYNVFTKAFLMFPF